MTLELDGPLVLAGCGNMGGAMLAGWLERGLAPGRIRVQDPAPPPAVRALLDRHAIAAEASVRLDVAPAVLLMAVKPQVMAEVFAVLAALAGPDTLVLSIAAGKTIASFEAALAPGRAVVRSIPNTPAAVGRGITAASPRPPPRPAAAPCRWHASAPATPRTWCR